MRRAAAVAIAFLCLVLPATAQFNQLAMFSPIGNETLVVDSTWLVRWFVPSGMTKLLRIDYSVDSGRTWKFIDTMTARPGIDTLPWVVPNDTTHKGMVRVSTSDDSASTKSRNVFTISLVPPSTLRVSYPNGGERLKLDSAVKIRWNGSNLRDTLRVELSIDSGRTWATIASGMPARNGFDSLSWTVAAADTTSKAFVRVSVPTLSLSDKSDRVFTIRPRGADPRVTVLYPNGGERFQVDSNITIRWTGTDLTGTVEVDYSIDSGATWRPVTSQAARNGIDSTRWRIPNDTTRTAFVRVRAASLNNVSDRSDRVFTIRSTPVRPTVTLSYPNGGEVFRPDSNVRIRWSASDVTGQLSIQLSIDGGGAWTPVGTRMARTGPDSIAWVVPASPSTNALIRVMSGSTVGDTSNAVFSIGSPVQPSIAVLAPIAGDRIVIDSVVTIRWIATGLIGSRIDLAWSRDGGMTFDSLSSRAVMADGEDSIQWTVPSVPITNVILRLRDRDSLTQAIVGPLAIIPRSPTGIAFESGTGDALRITPNPARDRIKLWWPGRATGNLAVVATDGSTVLRRNGMRPGDGIDISRLSRGAYSVVVTVMGGTMARRIVVE